MTGHVERFPGAFPGTIWTPPDIMALTRDADLVCRCRVQRVVDEERISYLVGAETVEFHRKVAVVSVEHAYKSAAATGPVEVELLVPDAPSAISDLHEGEDVVLFLKSRGARYALVDLTSSTIGVRPEAGASGGGRGSPHDAIRQALLDAADREGEGAGVARELLADLDWR